MTSPAHQALADQITRSIHLADSLGLTTVAIPLNEALERLTGRGIAPPSDAFPGGH